MQKKGNKEGELSNRKKSTQNDPKMAKIRFLLYEGFYLGFIRDCFAPC